ncbi:hypothetical protein ABMA27_010444 [Loxostege sticticalis]|uniref:Integrase catalytic domain-containing protein n=1 Tax=Loxostege sticticalis TaxID=481309 RepID=A0ABR3H5S0_LOXSC
MLVSATFTIYTIYTDRPLCYAFLGKKQNCSPRQFRHLDFISQFSTEFQHISGKDNVVADALSRINEVQISPVDLEVLAKAQSTDLKLAKYLTNENSLRLKKMKVRLICTAMSVQQCFKYVHIDLIGPLPPSGQYRYCLTAVDRFTCWPEVVPLSDITAETVAKAFISAWVAHFGCPTDIVTDRGRQFESALFQQLSQSIEFQHRETTAYHPKCNGLV